MRRTRAGLTLTELLVALAILAIAGALFLSRQVTRRGTEQVESATQMPQVVDRARGLAVQRKETVRLRVYSDGLWSVESPRATEPIAVGSITAPPSPLDLSIDARGRCRATPGWTPREEHRGAFDAGKCEWSGAAAP